MYYLTDGLMLFIIPVAKTIERRFGNALYKNCIVQKLYSAKIA